jgi:hypothetical protein
MAHVNNSRNLMDSRDIVARIDDLVDERRNLVDALENAEDTLADAQDDTSALSEEDREVLTEERKQAEEALADWDNSDEAEELRVLQALAEEGEAACSDWHNGEALIRDSYFAEFAQQYAEDIGAISNDTAWPCDCIDWERAAEELRQDFTSVCFDNVIYWIGSH